MTEQERQLIESLAARLRNSPAPEINPQADELIRRTIGSQPNALYILTQTVLLQELALKQGQASPPAFLGSAATPGTWGRDGRLQQEPVGGGYRGSAYQTGGVPPVPPVAAQPAPPVAGQPPTWVVSQPQSRMSSFLEGAAQTAAGMVAGQVAFSAVSSLFGSSGFGHHGGGFLGGGGYWGGGGISETVINNNYYGEDGERHQHHEADHDSSYSDAATTEASWADDLISDDTSYDGGTDFLDV